MSKLLLFMFKAAIFVFFVIAITEIYPRIKNGFERDLPLSSLYEIITPGYLDLSKPREANLNAYLSDDKRLYISQEDASYGFDAVSFPIKFEKSMEGCLNSYVVLRATVMYDANWNQILFSNFKFMDIVPPVNFYKTLSKPPFIPLYGIHCDS
ncbi:MAG: hypothetical protein ACI9SP_002778 [Arenicella sp.]|jgi:hypothetical protein